MKDPIRILQVFGRGMNRGGSETWMMHILRHIDRERFKVDFLVESNEPGDYDDEIRSLGSRILVVSDHHNPLAYARDLLRILRRNGPYDVVHFHLHHISGYALLLSHIARVPARLVHSHGDFRAFDMSRGLIWRTYTNLMRRLISRHATLGLAVSAEAASDLFGPQWQQSSKWRILYCGIDLELFDEQIDSFSVREELGISQDALVVGHVGRFYDYKNQEFLVRAAEKLANKEPRTKLLLVGEGPTFPQVREQVESTGLDGIVIFTGLRKDIPRLMRGAMDALVLPSLHEGLPLVGLEAQAAGLPLILSDVVSRELDVMPDRIRRLSLLKSPAEWADEILKVSREIPQLTDGEALRVLRGSPFDINSSVRNLEKIYAG